MTTPTTTAAEAPAERVVEGRDRILAELRKVIVGQDDVIDLVLTALFAGGHCLLTGVPGLAKTLLVKTLADVLHLSFKRIQFTPDLMPPTSRGPRSSTRATDTATCGSSRGRSSPRSSWPTRSTARRRRRSRPCSRRCRSTT